MNDEFENEHGEGVEDQEWISKTRRKKDSHELQELGEALVKLEDSALARIPLDVELKDAIFAARKMKQRGAHKRQLQFIGKLMRAVDVDPIRKAYETATNHYREDIKQLHLLESRRDRLIQEGDKALGELLKEYPAADRQHLRQLIRSINRETANSKPPKSARELFQYLKELMRQDADS